MRQTERDLRSLDRRSMNSIFAPLDPNERLPRELLLELVWNYDYLGDSRLVDVAVQRLRAKIEDDPKQPKLIQTVRGVGYRINPG